MKTNLCALSTLLALGLSTLAIATHAAPKAKTSNKPAAKTTTKPLTKPTTKSTAKPAAPKPAALQLVPTDPARFSKVPEWEGTFSVSSSQSGDKKGSFYHHIWSHSITVEGSFRVKYFQDPRDGDAYSWRGTGEAYVVINGKRTTYPGNLTPSQETYNGSYKDTISVYFTDDVRRKGTYDLVIRLDNWQDQPHKGKAINYVKVEGKNTYKSMVDGYKWTADSGAGSMSGQPLPKSGLIIKGSTTNKSINIFGHDDNLWKSNWKLWPVGEGFDEPLKAIAGGPYSTERGGVVVLNGGQSTGKIRSYKWKFEPVDAKSEIPFNAGATKEGARIPTTFLAPVKATLTVSDGKKEDSDSVIVDVKARDFKTPFVHRDGEKLHPQSIAPRLIKGRDLKYAGGENVCALDDYGAKDSVHVLHPAAAGGTWEDKGYVLKQVQDPGGPFDGVWYLAEYSVRIEREMLINKYLLPKGPPPVRTAKPFYESNKALGNNVDAYLEAVRKHELLHSELMKKGIADNDPGPKMEAWASKDKEPLKKRADETIQASEDAVDKASQDPLPSVGFESKIAFPDDATDKYISVDMAI